MLYLVSGASRSGKTIIARELLETQQIPYVSLDWLVMGFTNGIPQYGIHDKLFPDEIAVRLRSFLEAMCESMLWAGADCVIEGEAVLPDFGRTLLDKYPSQVRICFVGYTDIDVDEKVSEIREHGNGKDDWLMKESDEYVCQHVGNMVTHSRKIKAGCEEYNIPYFDTSADFLNAIDQAKTYLLGNA